jgi:hypothetical protein
VPSLSGHKLIQKRTGETREAVEKAVKEALSRCCKQAANGAGKLGQ